MKPPPFEYFRPETLDGALQLLGVTENCRVLAGGQSLMAMLNLRYVLPDALIDINRIPELAHINVEGDRVVIGAMTRQRVLERSPIIRQHLPIMSEALHHVGHRQTRNRGTIGGSLCHLDPSAELPTLCLAYDAEIEVASAQGRRRIGTRDFLTGYMSVDLAPGEMVTQLTFPIWRDDHTFAFLEHARRHGDFAIASAACLLERDESGRITRIAIAVGGVGEIPLRLDAAEALLLHTDGAPDLIARAAESIHALEALADVHADADYRLHVAATLVKRGLQQSLPHAIRAGV